MPWQSVSAKSLVTDKQFHSSLKCKLSFVQRICRRLMLPLAHWRRHSLLMTETVATVDWPWPRTVGQWPPAHCGTWRLPRHMGGRGRGLERFVVKSTLAHCQYSPWTEIPVRTGSLYWGLDWTILLSARISRFNLSPDEGGGTTIEWRHRHPISKLGFIWVRLPPN